jgi:nitrile hydratase
MVIPQRPSGTEGMDEDTLASLVTSDSLVGAAVIEPPRPQA